VIASRAGLFIIKGIMFAMGPATNIERGEAKAS
jgi:hypothetical protein